MYGCMLLKKKIRQKESGRQGAVAGVFEAQDESRGRSGRKKRRPVGEAGVALREMLLGICISGVLAAVAVPKFSQSMTLANTSKIQADLSTLNTAVGLYRAEKGVDPTKLDQLKDYIVNLDALKPPSGSYFLRDGKTKEKASTSYALTKGSDGETQATLDEHRVQDFGRAEKKEASGT